MKLKELDIQLGIRVRRKSWHPFCFIYYAYDRDSFIWGDIQNSYTDESSYSLSSFLTEAFESDWEKFKIPSKSELADYEKRDGHFSGVYQNYKILPKYQKENSVWFILDNNDQS